MLHRVTHRRDGGPRAVLVHGFTQTLRSWDVVAPELAAHREVARIDIPGHGGSADIRLGFVEAAWAVGQAGGRASYVGYSLGGRLCLHLALDHPELVDALVLVGASPGLADPAERAQRRRGDESLAAQIESEGTSAFVDRWLRQPMFAHLQPSAADLAARRANPPEGLAAALRLLGTGAQEPVWDRLGELTMPVQLVVGEADAKFDAIARDMATRMTSSPAEVVRIPGAGHAAHLERPREWTDAVSAFLDHHHAS
ncbi:MAG: alpha/beta fold hydrolase [Acidimicrobiales bacterium]